VGQNQENPEKPRVALKQPFQKKKGTKEKSTRN
jgi:hypothetical protein